MVRKGMATGMAGEFFVMEKLYRLGHQPTLTLGAAKSIDILAKTKQGNLLEVSVKAARGGGKWGVGKEDLSGREDMIFVFLLYKNFKDLKVQPHVFVIPALEVQKLKKPWHPGIYAVYFSNKAHRAKLEPFKDAWHNIGDPQPQ